MTRLVPVCVALFGVLGGSVSAQCTQLSGVIERDGKSYAFVWDGKEVVVSENGNEVSRSPAAADSTGAIRITDEKGQAIATLSRFGRDVLSLRTTPVSHTRASLDVSVEPPSEALAAHLGLDQSQVLLVRSIESDGAAAKGGLQRFDVIVAIDGEHKVDQESLRRALASKRPGDELALTILRRGVQTEVTVKLGANSSWPGLIGTLSDHDNYAQWLLHRAKPGAHSVDTPALLNLLGVGGTMRLPVGTTYSDALTLLRQSAQHEREVDTLADITRRLSEIEQMLKRLREDQAPEKGRAPANEGRR